DGSSRGQEPDRRSAGGVDLPACALRRGPLPDGGLTTALWPGRLLGRLPDQPGRSRRRQSRLSAGGEVSPVRRAVHLGREPAGGALDLPAGPSPVANTLFSAG